MKNKFRRINILVVLLFISGALVLLYAPVSQYLMKKQQQKVTVGYEAYVSGLDEEIIEEEWRKAEKYNDILAGRSVSGALLEGSGRDLPEDYYKILNVSGIMGVIRIPEIDVQLPIYHGTGEAVLRKGIGHIEKTALPIGGNGNHAVLTGHRALTTAELFTNLDKLNPGDMFYIEVLGRTLVYRIDQVLTTEPDDLSELRPKYGKDYVTLVTCTPYAVNSHRILVRGVRIQDIEADEEIRGEIRYNGYSFSLLVIVLVLSLLFIKMAKNNKNQTGAVAN